MSFLWPPALLFAFITVPLILLLHLLRNRRERLAISSLIFWRGLEQKRQGGRPRQIPLSLLLLLQLVAALVLTCGLARPTLSFILNRPEQTIFVLDITTSMTATDPPQSNQAIGSDDFSRLNRFDLARQAIRTHIQTMARQDKAAVVSLGPRPEILLLGSGDQKTTLLSTLDNLAPGAVGANLTAALSLAGGLVEPEQENRIIVLTDGNYPLKSQPIPALSAPLEWRFIPGVAADNQALLDLSAHLLPDGRRRIFARLVNFSDTPVVRTLRLRGNEVVLAEDVVEVEAQADITRLWTAPASTETVAVEIVEADALLLDNRAELLLLDHANRRVLLISDKPDILAKALEAQPGVELSTAAAANFSGYDLADFDLVVFDGLPVELTSWPPGALLVVNPPLGHPLLSTENSARNLRPDLSSASSLLAGIDLSAVYFSRAPRLSVPDWAEVDLQANEEERPTPLIFHGLVDNSRVMVWAFDLAASNLPARLALPLLTANTFSALLAPSLPSVVPVGEPVLLNRNFYVETPDGQRLFLDSGQTSPVDHTFWRTREPGLYRIYNNHDVLVAAFAVHAGSPLESNLGQRPWQPGELKTLETKTLPLAEPDIDYQDFWPWLAGLALAVIMVEGWLAWRR